MLMTFKPAYLIQISSEIQDPLFNWIFSNLTCPMGHSYSRNQKLKWLSSLRLPNIFFLCSLSLRMATLSMWFSKSEAWDASLNPPPLTSCKSSAIHLLTPSPPFLSSQPPLWFRPLSLTWMTPTEPSQIHSPLWNQNVHLITSFWRILTSPSSLAPPCHVPTFQPSWIFLFLKYIMLSMASLTCLILFSLLSPYLMPTLTSNVPISPISSGCLPSSPLPAHTHTELHGPAICRHSTLYSSLSRAWIIYLPH